MTKLLLTTILAATLAIVGTASAEDVPDRLFFTIEGQSTGFIFVGLVPDGILLEIPPYHVTGTCTDGLFEGAANLTGYDTFLIRRDGAGVSDVTLVIEIPDGLPISIKYSGIADPAMMPPFEAWLDPEYEVADVEVPYHGAATFRTMAPEYVFLNHMVFGFTGRLNFATGAWQITFRSLTE